MICSLPAELCALRGRPSVPLHGWMRHHHLQLVIHGAHQRADLLDQVTLSTPNRAESQLRSRLLACRLHSEARRVRPHRVPAHPWWTVRLRARHACVRSREVRLSGGVQPQPNDQPPEPIWHCASLSCVSVLVYRQLPPSLRCPRRRGHSGWRKLPCGVYVSLILKVRPTPPLHSPCATSTPRSRFPRGDSVAAAQRGRVARGVIIEWH
jgi:hypothetical protein